MTTPARSFSLDLLLTRPCLPRATLSDGELCALSHTLRVHEAIHAEVASHAEAEAPPSDDVALEDGEGSAVLDLGRIRARLASAWESLADCLHCPLNVLGRPVGCHVFLVYPVPVADEREVARAVAAACAASGVADAVLARTPVATPAFREAESGMFEGRYAPLVEVPWEGGIKGVSLDAFWDMLLAPRSAEDGEATAAVLTALQVEVEKLPQDRMPSAQLLGLCAMAFALRVWSASDDAGYVVLP